MKSVLVVEDDPIIALNLEEALLAAGAGSVTRVEAAAQALQELADMRPDLLILDLSLVDSDEGFGLAEIALELFNPPPAIIFSTGSPERVPEKLARRAKIYAKPYDPAELARVALS